MKLESEGMAWADIARTMRRNLTTVQGYYYGSLKKNKANKNDEIRYHRTCQ
jgi:hypothetical protein